MGISTITGRENVMKVKPMKELEAWRSFSQMDQTEMNRPSAKPPATVNASAATRAGAKSLFGICRLDFAASASNSPSA